MDGICFVLGVNAQHLRGKKVGDLVCNAAERAAGSFVELTYVVGPGDAVEGQGAGSVLRLRRDVDPSVYRVNGSAVTRADYERVLRGMSCYVRARNFLVFQGDVDGIARKSQEQLLEYLETVSGSGEFKAEYESLQAESGAAHEAALFLQQKVKGLRSERRQLEEQQQEADRFERLSSEASELRKQALLFALFHADLDVRLGEAELEQARAALEAAAAEETAVGQSAAAAAEKSRKARAGLRTVEGAVLAARKALESAQAAAEFGPTVPSSPTSPDAAECARMVDRVEGSRRQHGSMTTFPMKYMRRSTKVLPHS
jgi:structural maintenance of chromosome 1